MRQSSQIAAVSRRTAAPLRRHAKPGQRLGERRRILPKIIRRRIGDLQSRAGAEDRTGGLPIVGQPRQQTPRLAGLVAPGPVAGDDALPQRVSGVGRYRRSRFSAQGKRKHVREEQNGENDFS